MFETRNWYLSSFAICIVGLAVYSNGFSPEISDPVRALQFAAIDSGSATWGHWGGNPAKYSTWTNHSNRLIPVYTFGITLDGYDGEHSVYRSEEKLKATYGFAPTESLNSTADYFDQTQIYSLQQQAVASGKKYVFLVIFDGMDWQTTHAVQYLAPIARITRASVLEALHLPYIQTARAKGMAQPIVVLRHALPNALLPVVTLIGGQMGFMLAGAVLTETVFAWPGLGRVLLSAMLNRDFAVINSLFLIIAAGVILTNLAVDLLYTFLDPRVRVI